MRYCYDDFAESTMDSVRNHRKPGFYSLVYDDFGKPSMRFRDIILEIIVNRGFIRWFTMILESRP